MKSHLDKDQFTQTDRLRFERKLELHLQELLYHMIDNINVQADGLSLRDQT